MISLPLVLSPKNRSFIIHTKWGVKKLSSFLFVSSMKIEYIKRMKRANNYTTKDFLIERKSTLKPVLCVFFNKDTYPTTILELFLEIPLQDRVQADMSKDNSQKFAHIF